MRIRWWILLFCLAFGLVFFSSANAEEGMIEQKIFDELGDVREDTTGSIPGMPAIDILSVEVREEDVNATVWLTLAGNYSPDAVYQIRLRIDNAVDATLTLEGEDNFTGKDSRIGDWEVWGRFWQDADLISWEVPYGVLDVSYGLVVVDATTELLGKSTTRYWDSCDWDLNDIEKGKMGIEVWYDLSDLEEILRSVELSYWGEAAAGLRYNIDTDMDRIITQDEIDEYKSMLEGPGSDTQWTDMTLNTYRATSVSLNLLIGIPPGPLNNIDLHYINAYLTMTFPSPDNDPYQYRWQMELEGLAIPFWRATSASFYKMTPPWVMEKVAKFDTYKMDPAMATFYNDNATLFYMTGTEMSEQWNSTMRYDEGFTIILEKPPPTASDNWCETRFIIVAIPVAFVMVTGFRRGGKRTIH